MHKYGFIVRSHTGKVHLNSECSHLRDKDYRLALPLKFDLDDYCKDCSQLGATVKDTVT